MLNTIQRVRGYAKQSGKAMLWPNDLTSSQRRRVRQKARKRLETGGKVHRKPKRVGLSGDFSAFRKAMEVTPEPAETQEDFGPIEPPAVVVPLAAWERELMNACPRCKVTGDEPCVTPAGKATKTHKGRGE